MDDLMKERNDISAKLADATKNRETLIAKQIAAERKLRDLLLVKINNLVRGTQVETALIEQGWEISVAPRTGRKSAS